jgi:uncharacterized membrane protein SpoIIM required for sporulation
VNGSVSLGAVDLDRFLKSRRANWGRLEALLAQAERTGEQTLGTAGLQELLGLYRQACSDLQEARALTGNAAVLARLNDLTGRGYRFVYRRAPVRAVRGALARFFGREVPLTFQRERRSIVASASALALGALIGLAGVMADRRHGELLIPEMFFTESPRERVERIEKGEERIDSMEEALTFGASLYTHNIQVSFAAFALGALGLLGGVAILFYNGVILGAVGGLYVLDGVSTFFMAWVGPHGALEIPAIVFGGAAGLRAGRALLLPGDLSVGASMREAFPAVWRMMVATALILVVAGLIEGSFSQFTARTIPYPVKIGVAGLLFVALHAYLFWPRRGEGGRA